MRKGWRWFLVLILLVLHSPAASAVSFSNLTGAEYFVDVDPGEGNGVPMTLPPGTYDQSKGPITGVIDTDSLSVGLHVLYVRAMDSQGHWGTPRACPFEITPEPTVEPTITAAEWFVDSDPGQGAGAGLSALDGAFDYFTESLVGFMQTDTLGYGVHTLYVRARNSSGIWGATKGALFVVGSPNISVTPASNDFGDVMVGSPSAQTFTIANTGDAALIISSIVLTGGDSSKFGVAPGTCPSLDPTIPAGGGCQITVTFAPTSAVAKATTLRIESYDTDTPVIDIPLTGTGVLGPVVFADVPIGFWGEEYIKTLYYNQITSGCLADPLSYCPDDPVTRAQMAVFMLKSIGQGQAPDCNGSVFADVDNATQPLFCGWMEKFSELGITAGCQADDPSTININEAKYCPDSPVTRAQMAVFILKSIGQEQAPDCTGSVFSDVDSVTQPLFCGWIEKFSELGITAGCQADDPGTPENERTYCPDDDVTRAQMAIFLTKGFLQ